MISPVKKKRRKRKSSGYKRGFVETKKGGTCRYRSGWELAFVNYLDSDSTVEKFHYEYIRIPYISNGRTGRLRTYIPDIYVEYFGGKKELIEIKPERKLQQLTVLKKLDAARVWCSEHDVTLRIITERELRVLGLL